MPVKRNNKQLRDSGEWGFLDALLPRLQRRNADFFHVGPGDDAAVLPSPCPAVLTIDGLTDGTHFRSRWRARLPSLAGFSLGRGLGWKLIGSAVSDLAAMGDVDKRWVLIYLGAPPSTPLSFLNEFDRGVREASRAFRVAVAGGDTVRSRVITLVAAAGGLLKGKRVLKRSGAAPGDLIAIAGTVGDARIGLDVLDGKIKIAPRAQRFFIKRFFKAMPLFKAGAALVRDPGVSAGMDLSDPLDRSCEILFQKNGVGAEINVDQIPVSAAYRRARGVDARLLGAGEDYSLLFAASPAACRRLRGAVPFRIIGRVLPKKEGLRFRLNGKPVKSKGSFDHF